tara:strand:+ start:498 stop:695 length:198 start_codon:yes stop_codon:yes gene_type:complete
MLNRSSRMKRLYRTRVIVGLFSVGSFLLAQGVTFPSEPSQAPIGGLGWLAVLGGALAYKRLREKK